LLHAGVAARADERKKLERVCVTISRPAVSEERLSLTPGGNMRYELKTPYRNGTKQVLFESRSPGAPDVRLNRPHPHPLRSDWLPAR
jgi:hypothetical protein